MESKKFVGSGSPHIKSNSGTKRIMLDVIISLIPSLIAGIILFGIRVIPVVALSVLSAVVSEIVYSLLSKKTFKQASDIDLTSVVTGLLIGLSFNVKVAWFVPIFASVFAIIVVKMIFGGTGNNIVNPALAGRCFVFISFLGLSTAFISGGWVDPNGITVGATPLAKVFESGLNNIGISNLDLFLGRNLAGCIGETSKVAILIGFVYLSIRKVIDFKWPLIYIATTGLFMVALNGFDFNWFLPSILSGGLIYVAVFMATDYVTTPNTGWGNLLYFIGLGLLTAGLRIACQMEVVTFAVLLMNIIVPLIDKWIVPKPFGLIKKQKMPNTPVSDAKRTSSA